MKDEVTWKKKKSKKKKSRIIRKEVKRQIIEIKNSEIFSVGTDRERNK